MYMYNKDWINKGEYTDTLWKKKKKKNPLHTIYVG